MNSRERVARAVSFDAPDRPPVDLPTIAPGLEAYRTELKLSTLQDVAEYFGADTIRLEPDYIGPTPYPDWGKKYEKRGDGRRYITDDGHPFRNLSAEQIRSYPSPPASSPQWYNFDGYAEKCAPYADRGVFTSTGHSIMFFTWGLLGPQDESMMLFYTDPDKMNAALDRVVEYHLAFLDQLLSSHPDYPQYVFFNDDLCTQQGPFISPDIYRQFQVPRLKKVADCVHRHGRKLSQHCCGSIRALLPDIIDAGVDILHPIQPGAEGNDIYEIRKEFGRNIVLFLGLDMQDLMRTGTPRRITDYYRKIADDFSGGGLIFNVFPMPDIPLKNMEAFRAALAD